MSDNICNKCAHQNKCNYKKGSHYCFDPKKENAESIGLAMVKKMIKFYEDSQRSDTE